MIVTVSICKPGPGNDCFQICVRRRPHGRCIIQLLQQLSQLVRAAPLGQLLRIRQRYCTSPRRSLLDSIDASPCQALATLLCVNAPVKKPLPAPEAPQRSKRTTTTQHHGKHDAPLSTTSQEREREGEIAKVGQPRGGGRDDVRRHKRTQGVGDDKNQKTSKPHFFDLQARLWKSDDAATTCLTVERTGTSTTPSVWAHTHTLAHARTRWHAGRDTCPQPHQPLLHTHTQAHTHTHADSDADASNGTPAGTTHKRPLPPPQNPTTTHMHSGLEAIPSNVRESTHWVLLPRAPAPPPSPPSLTPHSV